MIFFHYLSSKSRPETQRSRSHRNRIGDSVTLCFIRFLEASVLLFSSLVLSFVMLLVFHLNRSISSFFFMLFVSLILNFVFCFCRFAYSIWFFVLLIPLVRYFFCFLTSVMDDRYHWFLNYCLTNCKPVARTQSLHSSNEFG